MHWYTHNVIGNCIRVAVGCNHGIAIQFAEAATQLVWNSGGSRNGTASSGWCKCRRCLQRG